MNQCYRFLLTLSLAGAVLSSCSRPAYLFRSTLPAYLSSGQGQPPAAAPEAEAAPGLATGPAGPGVAPPRPVAVRAAGRLPGKPPPLPAPQAPRLAKKTTRLLTSAWAKPQNTAQTIVFPIFDGRTLVTLYLLVLLYLAAAIVFVHGLIWLLSYLIRSTRSASKPRPVKTSQRGR